MGQNRARSVDLNDGNLAAAMDRHAEDEKTAKVVLDSTSLTDAQILQMNWLVDGVQGKVGRQGS